MRPATFFATHHAPSCTFDLIKNLKWLLLLPLHFQRRICVYDMTHVDDDGVRYACVVYTFAEGVGVAYGLLTFSGQWCMWIVASVVMRRSICVALGFFYSIPVCVCVLN